MSLRRRSSSLLKSSSADSAVIETTVGSPLPARWARNCSMDGFAVSVEADLRHAPHQKTFSFAVKPSCSSKDPPPDL